LHWVGVNKENLCSGVSIGAILWGAVGATAATEMGSVSVRIQRTLA